MFIRRQRFPEGVRLVPAHLPITHVATPEESDKHKAMKERIARAASQAGLDVRVEAGVSRRKVVNDVLVTGPDGTRIGWEAQYSPVSASSVRRRTARAAEHDITSLWVTTDSKSELIDRAPWIRVDDVSWKALLSPQLQLIERGGVRRLQVWKCTRSSPRPCPRSDNNGTWCDCGHAMWTLPALCLPEQSPARLDELVASTARRQHLPLTTRSIDDPRRVSRLWAPAADIEQWRQIRGEEDDEPDEEEPDDEVVFTGDDIDTSCRYGEPTEPHHPNKRTRDRNTAVGLHTFDAIPATLLHAPTKPAQLDLANSERAAAARALNCHVWEIGPCMFCSQPINRYGHNAPMACSACRLTHTRQ
ncbi:competence protein CoiA family protein [Streptomyces sp. NPDC054784]